MQYAFALITLVSLTKSSINRAVQSRMQEMDPGTRADWLWFLENISNLLLWSKQATKTKSLHIIRKDIRNKMANTSYPKPQSSDQTENRRNVLEGHQAGLCFLIPQDCSHSARKSYAGTSKIIKIQPILSPLPQADRYYTLFLLSLVTDSQLMSPLLPPPPDTQPCTSRTAGSLERDNLSPSIRSLCTVHVWWIRQRIFGAERYFLLGTTVYAVVW